VFCFVQMKGKWLSDFMTCGVRFGKSEDLLKLDGICRPASYDRSTDAG